MKQVLILLLIALLPLAGSALVVTRSYSNSTTDNDNNTQEDASSSSIAIGSSHSELSSVGQNTTTGCRFTGQASAYKAGDLTQTINVTVTWTITAEDWEEYSIALSPELHAWLNIYDYSTDETDDVASFSSLSSILRVNGSIVSDTLDGLTGIQRSTDGSSTLNKTDSQTLNGYFGNNVFSLQFTGTVYVVAHDGGGLFDNPTGDAVLWGEDGTLNFEQNTAQNGFDEYSKDADRDADGIFVDATVTLDAVPEPASLLLIGTGAALLGVIRRFYGVK